MQTIPRLIGVHTSPFTERARWALDLKRAPYERVPYRIGAGEEELWTLTGQRQVPVLVIDGEAIPDSTAILDLVESRWPEPALLPADGAQRTGIVLHEELAAGVLGPQARQLLIGRMLSSSEEGAAPVGRFFAQKYGHSGYSERHARSTVRRVLTVLVTALEGRRYLVGDAFSRADLTVAAMLMVVRPPPEELFACVPAWTRALFEDPMGREAGFRPLFEWRDRVYRDHRGGRVTP